MNRVDSRRTRWSVPLAGMLAVLLVVGGFVLGWRIAPESTAETAVGRVAFEVSPSFSGQAEAVVPVADWGFRADAFDGPFTLRAELRALDRDTIASAADGDLAVLGAAESDLKAGAQKAVLTAFAWGAGTALVLLVLASALWRTLRPRWTLLAIGAGLIVLLGGASLALARSSFDASAFERPTYFANGAELQRILDVVEDERVSSRYGSEFASILLSISTILTDAPGPREPGRSLYAGSDLHANALVVRPLSETIGDDPLLLAGDFGQRGGVAEARALAPRVAALGSRVIATSGNHDTVGLMQALDQAGVTVLGDSATGVPGQTRAKRLRVAGFPDPLAWDGRGDPKSRSITFDDLPDPEAALAEAEADLLAAFDALEPAPDVVMIHQDDLAQALAETLSERGYDRDLVIVTGHTHQARVDRHGSVVVVNGGSIGAGGVFGTGQEPIGLARLHFDARKPELRSVDLIAIEPLSGQAQAARVVIDALCPGEQHCAFEPPALDASVLGGKPESSG